MGRGSAHEALVEDLTRRRFLRGAGALAIALSAGRLAAPTRAAAAPNASDAMLQAFADTMVPGRKAATTDLGNEIDPRAIAGVDPLPGAVEADALALYHHPEIGFDNPSRQVWEAAAAVPFTAFCAAAMIGPPQTAAKASGYRVMGLPGAAP